MPVPLLITSCNQVLLSVNAWQTLHLPHGLTTGRIERSSVENPPIAAIGRLARGGQHC
jgi:hypothetical protein